MFKNNNEANPTARRHDILDIPVLGGLLMMLLGFTAYQLAAFPADENEMLANLLSMVSCAALLFLHRWWFRPELKTCVSFSFLKDRGVMIATGVFFAAVFAIWIPGVKKSGIAAPGIAVFIEALAAGLCEETSFRVLPISVMMRSGKDSGRYLTAVLLPAILFGLIHFINLEGTRNATAVVLQVINASALGIFFAAVYLRTGSLIPSFAIHFLYDFIVLMQAPTANGTMILTTGEMVGDGILDAVELILAFLLMKGRKRQITELWKRIWNGSAVTEL